MRSLVLFTIGGALLVIALATGCKSDDAAAKKPAASDPDTTAASGDSAAGQPSDPAPSLPVPRRMRSGESADGGVAEQDRDGRGGWRGPRTEQMKQRMAEMRKRFDANGDGQLDDEERDAMRRVRIQDAVKRIDADGDGTISRDEAETARFGGGRMLRDFDAVDANQDSVISPEELEAAMSERQARRRQRWQERRDGDSNGAAEGSPAD
jgi:hypothetical protein